jgi:acetyl esterase/lipase
MASPQLQAIIQAFRSQPVSEGMTIEQARAGSKIWRRFPPSGRGVGGAIDATYPPNGSRAGSDERRHPLLATGGYSISSLSTHRGMLARISAASGSRVFAIDYRLAPENPVPAGLEDALARYKWLLAQGVDPRTIIIGGDSAGGGLTLATLISLRDPGIRRQPSSAYSPWTDLAFTGESVKTRKDIDPGLTDRGGGAAAMPR